MPKVKKEEIKTKKNTPKDKKPKDITEFYDNSVNINMSLNGLTEKELNSAINSLDKFQKDFKKNIDKFYIKTSSNKTTKKGKLSKSDLLRDFDLVKQII